jgi:hypothetical protein
MWIEQEVGGGGGANYDASMYSTSLGRSLAPLHLHSSREERRFIWTVIFIHEANSM